VSPRQVHAGAKSPGLHGAITGLRAWAGALVVLMILGAVVPETVYAAEAEHAESIWITLARFANFVLLAAGLVYFLKSPAAAYLASRGTQIRQDLVTAAQMREGASAQLADITQKMQSLPAELEALKRQGADDVRAEQARITQAASAERERLLEQMRREIDMRMRVARRDLTEHAARLAVNVAEERIKRVITPADQLRLIDRYAAQLKEAR
jgi:F-type H+-transporting ATPase subunit b